MISFMDDPMAFEYGLSAIGHLDLDAYVPGGLLKPMSEVPGVELIYYKPVGGATRLDMPECLGLLS